MKIIVKIITVILNLIFSCLKLLPVRRKVVFISSLSDRKTEDMKIIEKQMRKEYRYIETVFLCRKTDPDFIPAFRDLFHMFRQMYHVATSETAVLDSCCPAVSMLKQRRSLTVIQMWHELGLMNRFGLTEAAEDEDSAAEADMYRMHRNYTWAAVSSGNCAEAYAEAFGCGLDRIKVMPLPRVDELTDWDFKESALRRISAEYPDFREKKAVVYVPEMRDRDISAEIRLLAAQFPEDEYVFVVKKPEEMETDIKEEDGIFIDERFTAVEMMAAADYVICDYSLLVFEAAVMGKPMFFYTFDLDEYRKDHSFCIDYEEEMPGTVSPHAETIAAAIAARDYDYGKIWAFARRYVDSQENCTEKMTSFIADSVSRPEADDKTE